MKSPEQLKEKWSVLLNSTTNSDCRAMLIEPMETKIAKPQMKLIETIERCEKLVIEEIEGCEQYLVWYENSISDTKESKEEIQKVNERKNELLEMMNNLRFIKYETNLREFDI